MAHKKFLMVSVQGDFSANLNHQNEITKLSARKHLFKFYKFH